MTISRGSLFQAFKYAVYVLLAMNAYWFFIAEHAAAQVQFPGGPGWGDLRDAYVATIDTVAWVVLLLMFELETSVLEDKHFTRPVAWTLHGLRIICYAFVVSAFVGYVSSLLFVESVHVLDGVDALCGLADSGWSYATGLDEYMPVTAANCGDFSADRIFLAFDGTRAVVDLAGHRDIVGLAWIDVINSAVWLLVVLVLEIDVRLQEHNRYEGLVLKISTVAKTILYGALLTAAVYWGFKGNFVDFWDAFLWLVAFVFIEMNVFDWHQEELKEAATGDLP